MSVESKVGCPGFVAKALAVCSAATFWLLPVSPLIAMLAVIQTKNLVGWPRTLSVAAAVLCSVYTIAVAILFYCLTIYILRGGLDQLPSQSLFRY
jgi:type IV secretory pathway TrbL component